MARPAHPSGRRHPNNSKRAGDGRHPRVGLRRLRGLNERADQEAEGRSRRTSLGYLARRLSRRRVRFTFPPLPSPKFPPPNPPTPPKRKKTQKNLIPPLLPPNRSPQTIEHRLDKLIHDIRNNHHAAALQPPHSPGDVLIVAHGHILRAFAMRWIGRALTDGVALLLEGIKILSFSPLKVSVKILFKKGKLFG